eukprot:1459475-Amphidinium_carterae.1
MHNLLAAPGARETCTRSNTSAAGSQAVAVYAQRVSRQPACIVNEANRRMERYTQLRNSNSSKLLAHAIRSAHNPSA